jgi:hypothetical protein
VPTIGRRDALIPEAHFPRTAGASKLIEILVLFIANGLPFLLYFCSQFFDFSEELMAAFLADSLRVVRFFGSHR